MLNMKLQSASGPLTELSIETVNGDEQLVWLCPKEN